MIQWWFYEVKASPGFAFSVRWGDRIIQGEDEAGEGYSTAIGEDSNGTRRAKIRYTQA